MTTKAEDFDNEQRWSRPKTKKKVSPKLKALSGHQKRGVGHTAARHPSGHAARHGGPALEDSATVPSRKSTRKSVDHTKRTTNQQLKAVRKTTSPSNRAVAKNRGKRK